MCSLKLLKNQLPLQPSHSPIVLDTGATGHFLAPPTTTDSIKNTNPIQVTLPDNSTITSTHLTQLPLPTLQRLPTTATQAHVFPTLQNNLLSIGKLCDHGCIATFDKKQAIIKYDNHTVLTGTRTPNGLWTCAPAFKHRPAANSIQPVAHKIKDHIKFLHAACFSPVPSTWLHAISKNHFTTWPAINRSNVAKHMPHSPATVKGHMDQIRQNLRSTKPPPNPDGTNKTFEVYSTVETFSNDTNQTYSDLTGQFPITASSGVRYLLVLYDYDSNYIFVHPLKNRTGSEIIKAHQQLFQRMKQAGSTPKLHRLDNEASKDLKQFLRTHNIDFQLAPPHIHRRNAAERAIRTFKNHFLAGLCSVDPNFPMHLWDKLLPQAELTLNLLRTSRTHPKLSSYTHQNGPFDFNRTPLAPPGTKIVLHEKPKQRQTWAPHGLDGWYIGPAMEHYRCYHVYVPSTRSTRIVDTIEFFPHHVPLPATSSHDRLIQAAAELIDTLQQPQPATPYNQLSTDDHAALRQLADIFHYTVAPRVEEETTKPTAQNQPEKENHKNIQIVKSAPRAPPLTAKPSARARQSYVEDLQTLEAHNIATIRPAHNILLEPDLNNQHDQYHVANAVTDPHTGAPLEYQQLFDHHDPKLRQEWHHSSANEFGRLAQGVGTRIKGTDTIFFIHPSDIPKHKKATYARFVCEKRPQKTEVNRTRITVGGNLIDYPGDVSTRTADLTTTKILLNSTVSDDKASFMTMDVRNYYLGTPLPTYEYMRFRLKYIPMEIRIQYNLDAIAVDGWVYVEIRKGMYGLPQAGILANQLLKKRLARHGYSECTHTPGLWTHTWRPITFVLVVDDFGVKYTGREHALHLAAALKENYDITTDWSGSLFLGITLTWNYKKRTVQLSMPNYIQKTLARFQHPKPTKPEHSPHRAQDRQIGVKVQLTEPVDTSPRLSKQDRLNIQRIIGTLLYYGRAVDPTLSVALSALAAAQSTSTEKTAKAITKLLNYCATHPDASIQYHKSDMILRVHSDTSYLSEPKARSRAGGYFFMGNKDNENPNGAILTPTGVIRVVVSSAAEAETAGLFTNMKEATILQTTLEEMGHPQPATPIQVDNSTACGIANNNIQLRRSRAIDMRFYWVRDRVDQAQFHVYWKPGRSNLADYVTKHHTAAHHQTMRPIYLHQANLIKTMKLLNQLVHQSHCEGVLIPRTPRDHSPVHLDHTSQAWEPLASPEEARKPDWDSIATKWPRTQAKTMSRLII